MAIIIRVTSNKRMICTQINGCNSRNAENYLAKDYPRYYSSDGQPPSGLNPYQDDANPGKNSEYYKLIRSAVPHQPDYLKSGGDDGRLTSGYASNKYSESRRLNYTPIPNYLDMDSDKTADYLDPKYRDQYRTIYRIEGHQNRPNVVREDSYTPYAAGGTKFNIESGERYSPRWLNQHPSANAPIRDYYYYPQQRPQFESLAYAKTLHAQKYNTAKQNRHIVEARKKGINEFANELPYNHVEWKGRVYDCGKLSPTKWCLDPLYGSEVHAKCEAQGKYLGRTDGGKCSLSDACLPQTDFTNNVVCVKSIEDAGRYGLLTNTKRRPAQCHSPLRSIADNLNMVDYWKNLGYVPRRLKPSF